MDLGDKYKIESDSMNITVYEKNISKSDNVYWRPIAFFSKSEQALTFIADLEVRKTGFKDLKSVAEKQDEIYRLISSLEKA